MQNHTDTRVSLAHLYVVSFVVRMGDEYRHGSADVFLSRLWGLGDASSFEAVIKIQTSADHCSITGIFYAGEKIKSQDQLELIDSVRLDRGHVNDDLGG